MRRICQRHAERVTCLILSSLLICAAVLVGNAALAAETELDQSVPTDADMLEPVKVTEARIARFQRTIPTPDHDPGVTEPNRNEGVWAGELVSQPSRGMVVATRRLQDETAARLGTRTRVQRLTADQPLYPRLAREAGWQGTVIIRMEVLEDGTAGNVAVGKSCGYEILDQAAVAAAKGWRFAPLTDGGFTFRTTAQVPVVFDLKDF